MKKILCFVLVVILMFSLCTLSGFAAETQRCFDDEFYLERFEKTMNRLGSGYDSYYWDEQFTEFMACKTEGEVEYTLILPNGLSGQPMEGYKHVGEYVLTFSNYAPFYTVGIYVYVVTDDEIYTLTEAYDMKISRITEVFEFLAEKGICAVAGDTNLDGKLNVMDATTIQKQIAGLIPTFSSDAKDKLNNIEDFLYYAVKDLILTR